MKHSFIRSMYFFICLLILSAAAATVYAEQMYSPSWGYVLDIPEGFVLSHKTETQNYQFEHSLLPLILVINSWPEDGGHASQKIGEALKKLNAQADPEQVLWRDRECSLCLFDMKMQAQTYKGWGACIPLDGGKGTTVILCYADTQHFEALQPVMLSTLDSFSPSAKHGRGSGIITSFAYPAQGSRILTLKIGNTEITAETDISDIEAQSSLIEREYGVLTLFAQTPLWKQAWQRYYRMIYRDAYKRLEKTAFNIYNALEAEARGENPENKDRILAQKLLSWTQSFPYERRKNNSDFTPLPAVLAGAGSDCDSRALLLAVLMSQMNYNTMLFISPEYSHALFGIAIEGKGARLNESGTAYLLGETTAQTDIGLVAQDMSDSTKWFGITGLER